MNVFSLKLPVLKIKIKINDIKIADILILLSDLIYNLLLKI